ncbi:hypothetical protein TA3x_005732 (plasmid) [Tundrisphaera sp. TA3]|uniref:hypothetical protein n=1 Tax=Tundrisphaera sp. TA3 TaxID=3435775 RepID=UPI003EB86E27
MPQPGDGSDPDPVATPADAAPPKDGPVRADPDRGLIIVDLAGRERPYLVTRAEALLVLVLAEAAPGWISGAEMRRREPRIYNPAVVLQRLKSKGLAGFRIETDAGKRMRLIVD